MHAEKRGSFCATRRHARPAAQVGPGEADDGLDAEVGEECNGKYGPVTR